MPNDSASQEPSAANSGEQVPNRVVVLGEGAMRIAYQQQGDRFGHHIVIAKKSGLITLLESVEGAPDGPWPESPPLQELEVEPRGDQEVALLVGMAGASHWSASVEVDTDQLRFDIACRTRDTATCLGSTYLVVNARLLPRPNGTVLIQSHDEKTTVELTPHDDFSTRFKLLGDGRLWIGPDVEIDKTPTTVRWQYSLRLAGS